MNLFYHRYYLNFKNIEKFDIEKLTLHMINTTD